MQQRRSDINLLYVCTRQNPIMADLVASEISESDLTANLKLAQLEVARLHKFCKSSVHFFAKKKQFNIYWRLGVLLLCRLLNALTLK